MPNSLYRLATLAETREGLVLRDAHALKSLKKTIDSSHGIRIKDLRSLIANIWACSGLQEYSCQMPEFESILHESCLFKLLRIESFDMLLP